MAPPRQPPVATYTGSCWVFSATGDLWRNWQLGDLVLGLNMSPAHFSKHTSKVEPEQRLVWEGVLGLGSLLSECFLGVGSASTGELPFFLKWGCCTVGDGDSTQVLLTWDVRWAGGTLVFLLSYQAATFCFFWGGGEEACTKHPWGYFKTSWKWKVHFDARTFWNSCTLEFSKSLTEMAIRKNTDFKLCFHSNQCLSVYCRPLDLPS